MKLGPDGILGKTKEDESALRRNMLRIIRWIKMLKKLKICFGCGSKNKRKNSEDNSGMSKPRDPLEHSKIHSPDSIHPTHRQDIGKVSLWDSLFLQ